MSISGTAAGRPHSISYSVVCRCGAVDEDADVGARAAHVEREHVRLPQRAGDVLGRGHAAGRAGHDRLDRRVRCRAARAWRRRSTSSSSTRASSRRRGASRRGSRRSGRTAGGDRRRRSSSTRARTRARSARPRRRPRPARRAAPRPGSPSRGPRGRCGRRRRAARARRPRRPDSRIRRQSSRTSSSSIGRTSAPSASSRSPSPRQSRRLATSGFGFVPAEVVEHLAVDPLDERRVLEAARRHERDLAAGALDQRVRPDGRAVGERLDRRGGDAALVERIDDRPARRARASRTS